MRYRLRTRTGFTLIEALAAIAIMALAGSVMLLAAQTSLDATDDAVNQAIAQGICEQVLDEIFSNRYMAAGEAYNFNKLNHGSSETRKTFNDTDDFNDYSCQPIQDLIERNLGTGNDASGLRHANFRVVDGFFARWRLKVDIYYVSATDMSVRLDNPPVPAGNTLSTTSGYRAAEVTVEYQNSDGSYQTLANGRRVYAYVPPPT